jgi:hypothetical protein
MPPKLFAHSRKINFTATEAWVARVDEWRKQQASQPTRSEVIRKFVDDGLDAADKAADKLKPKKG